MIPLTGRFRALVFFVRFRDDDFDPDPSNPNSCPRGWREWESHEDLPDIAPYVLDASPTPPFADSSLTAQYAEQSRGNFILYGDDGFGYETALDEADYTFSSGEFDWGMLSEEVLDAFDPTIDYTQYDENGDGYLDHAFIVIRRLTLDWVGSSSTSGISSLGFSYTAGLKYDGVNVSSGLSGSGNRHGVISPLGGLVGLLNHEFGHDVWTSSTYLQGVHLTSIRGNFVPNVAPPYYTPSQSYPTPQAFADEMTGYATMLGGGSGSQIVSGLYASAFERALPSLNIANPSEKWIDCQEFQDGQTYSVRDLMSQGDCFRLTLATTPRIEELYVSNLQRGSSFGELDTVQTNISSDCPGCHELQGGTPTTGLLVERTSRDASADYDALRDIVPGDNGLELLFPCDAILTGTNTPDADVYDGDLWRPEERRQLSAWTRPNVYGYTFGTDVPANIFAAARPVLDDFRYGAGPPDNRPIEFDYAQDALALDTFYVRDNSWMDPASNGLAFAGLVVVEDGATLTVENGTTVAFSEGLVIQPGGHVEAGAATLAFGPGAFLAVAGTLDAQSTTFTEDDAGQGWTGITVYQSGALDFDGVEVSEAEIGVEVLSDDVVIEDSDTVRNTVGIASDYTESFCLTPPDCLIGPAPERSSFSLLDSRVANSEHDGTSTTGIGIAARNADAEIRQTNIEYNDGFGLGVWNADVFPYRQNVVTGNGNDGLRMIENGGLQMTNFSLDNGFDCVVENTDEEIELSVDAYLFMGNTIVGGQNTAFDDDLDADTYLIARATSAGTIPAQVPAQRSYWGTGGAPPSGAFNTPVDASNPLAGDPNNCTFLAGRGTSAESAFGGLMQGRTMDTGDEQGREMEWLREEIQSGRAALVQALAGEGDATGALRSLYRAQRLDRGDVLGEHAETMAQIAAVRALLTGGVLSDEFQAAGEAALITEVADALRHGAYDEAEALVSAHEVLVRNDDARRSVSLHAAMADEAVGRLDAAYARVEAVYTALVAEEEFEAAEGPAFVLAALAARMDRGAAPEVTATSDVESRNGTAPEPPAVALGTPYPNPSAGSVTVPLTLPEASEAYVVVYDVLGREVATLADGALADGHHALVLDAAQLPAGVYLVRVEAGAEQALTRRFTVLR